MSVLTRLEATPSRVSHLLSFLADRSAGETEERLRDFFAPETLLNKDASDPYTVFKATLGAARDLGLCEAEGEKVRIRSDLQKRSGHKADFVDVFEAVLLAPDSAGEQADFARAMAWFLMQHPSRPLQFQKNYKLVIQEQLQPGAPAFDLLNSDRWNTFTYWCRYLGFGVALAGRALAPDPTAALRRLIPLVMEADTRMFIGAFFGRLAEISPVFEQGAARKEVEGWALPRHRPEGARLSRSTSLALVRLEQEGLVELDSGSDAPDAAILDLSPDSTRRVSRIERRGAAR